MSLKAKVISIADGLMIAADLHRTDTQKRYAPDAKMNTHEALQILIDRLEFTASELVKAIEEDERG